MSGPGTTNVQGLFIIPRNVSFPSIGGVEMMQRTAEVWLAEGTTTPDPGEAFARGLWMALGRNALPRPQTFTFEIGLGGKNGPPPTRWKELQIRPAVGLRLDTSFASYAPWAVYHFARTDLPDLDPPPSPITRAALYFRVTTGWPTPTVRRRFAVVPIIGAVDHSGFENSHFLFGLSVFTSSRKNTANPVEDFMVLSHAFAANTIPPGVPPMWPS